MAVEINRRAPAAVRSTSLDRGSHRSFLADVAIDFGPEKELSRMFPLADAQMRERGIRLSFASFDELVAVNRRNGKSWRPILPLFDPAFSDVDDSNGYALIGRNGSGEVVFTYGSRLFNLGEATLKDEIEGLRVFYREPERDRADGEAMRVTAPTASERRGLVAFTGAAWARPDYRKANLVHVTTPLTRGLSHTRWGWNFLFSFMAPEVVRGGIARECRMHAEWEVEMINTPVLRDETLHAALVWTDWDTQLGFIRDFLAEASPFGDTQVDRVVDDRASN